MRSKDVGGADRVSPSAAPVVRASADRAVQAGNEECAACPVVRESQDSCETSRSEAKSKLPKTSKPSWRR